MTRTSEEWSGLLGSTLSKMALVRGTDSPGAYLPDECFVVIEKVFAVALEEAHAAGYAAAVRDLQHGKTRREGSAIAQAIRAFPSVRLFA